MTNLFDQIRNQLADRNVRIVLPEGNDERVLQAAMRLHEEGIVTPILLGDETEIHEQLKLLGYSEKELIIRNPKTDGDRAALIEKLVERRNGKVSSEDAVNLLEDVNYFGTMLVYAGQADGLVSGAAHTTAETIRPALQIIKTKPGIQKTSGAFLMVRGEEQYVFADCAITIAPTSEDLAEIAIASSETAKSFGLDPKVAMLSFSTKGSASSPETEKVAKAVELVQNNRPELAVDGEIQFDAALIPTVAAKKAPDSAVAGQANVFVFPSLEAGNIGYKIAQRLGGFEAIGPVLQGLNQPVNDLSRGCSADDVYFLSLITAAQSLK